MRKCLFVAALLISAVSVAQTARQITVNITPDGKANMVGLAS